MKPKDGDTTCQQFDQSRQTPILPTTNEYNNRAKSSLDIIPKIMSAVSPNYENYTKFFPGANLESIKKTFQAMTQLGTRGAVKRYNLRNHILAPNPMLTTPRQNGDVATDTLYSHTPAIDDGYMAAQFY